MTAWIAVGTREVLCFCERRLHDSRHCSTGLSRSQGLPCADGIQAVMIDPESSELATPTCPTTRSEVYVSGSAPTELCELHGGRGAASGSWLSHIFGGGQPKPPPSQIGPDGKPLPPDQQAGAEHPPGVPTGKPPKRKRTLCRKFLVSLGARRRTPTRPSLRRRRETPHDEVSCGSFSKHSPSGYYQHLCSAIFQI